MELTEMGRDDMASRNPYEAYKTNALTTASPGELTLMLYDGCLKFIGLAKQAMTENQVEERNNNIQKAQDIVLELMATLNMDVEVAQSMMPLYEFVHRRLLEANIRQDMESLKEAEGIMTEFRDAWKEALQINRRQRHASSGVVSI
jgi:flagellar protein FliS